MNIITVNNISKSYGEKTLFENISFTIAENDKIGLIGINGTGKSTLLKVITGYEVPESGEIIIPKGISIEYLPQNPDFDYEATVVEQIFKSDTPAIKLISKYEKILEELAKNPNNGTLQQELLNLTNKINSLDAWDLESQVKTVLTQLGITDFDKKMGTLSGGQKKRIALASALISPCNLLILDEPTNHMDNNTIDWLEKYLENKKVALIMITHDRYFLDRVVNKIFELDCGDLYSYIGNYSTFIEKKIERKNLESVMEKKRQSLFKKELSWIRTGAKARSTKQKARINRFEELKNTNISIDDSKLDISIGNSRLGKKIIEIDNISKKFGETKIIDNFSYNFNKSDCIGIIGNNGIGKSTLLNLIIGKFSPDNGSIDIGTTVKIAYFSQESEDMNPELRSIEYIKETAEYITIADGTKISASQMMERFLFSKDMQWTYIAKLSGGEKRRLYLLKILMKAPNVLILDEPTNDLDIETLTVLEDYIDDFNGTIIAVSHDRYFLDKICNKIFHFEGNGKIIEYTGNYSNFLAKKKEINTNNLSHNFKEKKKSNINKNKQKIEQKKIKLTYKEKIEYEKIDSEIEKLENKLSELDNRIQKNATDYGTLQELMNQKSMIEEDILYKMERQEYLSKFI